MSLVVYKGISYKNTSFEADVPEHPMAKLMYYAYCVYIMTRYDIPEKLRDYENYYMLSKEDEDKVLILITALSPDLLISKKFMILDDGLCTKFQNEFYEINDKSKNPAKKISLGGKTIESYELMACKQKWIDKNYYEPKKLYSDRILYISQRNLNL